MFSGFPSMHDLSLNPSFGFDDDDGLSLEHNSSVLYGGAPTFIKW
jgi:hypothetical protein